LYLQSKTDFFSSSFSVLDVAPSYFQQQKFKSQTNLKYISADLTAPWVMMKIDLAFIPFPNDYFDCVICYHVLEHIPNDRQAMREIFRTLKPGGWAILQSPIDQTRTTTFEDPKAVTPKDRLRSFGQNDHFRIYGQDYSKRLEEVGFQVKIDSFVQNFSEDDIIKFGILREEMLFVCFKPHYRIP
jgi:ubiquinone/menaquinone biosynthesis C-methylase UbiE